ncbi:MAG: IS256 family transposase [Anaerovoracaceae bacterium]|jgi:putative transposase
MSQVNITVNYEEVIALLSKDRNEAFGYLMERILNEFLLAESEEQIGAAKHERTAERSDYRNGTRERPLVTRIGTITLRVPRHRDVPFVTMVFDNYQRSEAALLTTMMEMVIQGVSTRKVTKVVEELCGTSFSKSTVSELCKRMDEGIKEFKNRKLTIPYPFVITDAKYFKVRENHRIVSKALMVAMGITEDGRREIIGFDAYEIESAQTWKEFLTSLKERGLTKMNMVTSDAHSGLIAALKEVFPQVPWQRCQYHFLKNILDQTPKKAQAGLQSELREMFTAETIEDARRRRDEIIKDYEDVAEKAMETLDEGFEDAMTVMLLPEKMRIPLRTSNYVERENGELGRRYNAIRIFPNTASLIRLMGAVLVERHDILSSRRPLFSKQKYDNAIKDITPQLIEIANEQVKLLKAA